MKLVAAVSMGNASAGSPVNSIGMRCHNRSSPWCQFRLLYPILHTISRASADLVLTALRESGYLPPDNASDADIVRLLDETGASFSRSAAEADAHARALLQAAAVAMRAGDPFAAMTFIDGPEGAGIG